MLIFFWRNCFNPERNSQWKGPEQYHHIYEHFLIQSTRIKWTCEHFHERKRKKLNAFGEGLFLLYPTVWNQHRLNNGIQEEHFQGHTTTHRGHCYASLIRWNNLKRNTQRLKTEAACPSFIPTGYHLSALEWPGSSNLFLHRTLSSTLVAFNENSLITAGTILDVTNFPMVFCKGDWVSCVHSTLIFRVYYVPGIYTSIGGTVTNHAPFIPSQGFHFGEWRNLHECMPELILSTLYTWFH